MTFITNVFFFVEPLDNFPVPLEQLAEEIPVREMFIRQLDERLRLRGSIIKMFEGKQPVCEKVFRRTDSQRQDFIQAHVESRYWNHFYVNDRNIVLYSAVVEYNESQFQIRAARKTSQDGSLDLPIGAPEALLDNEADDLNRLVEELLSIAQSTRSDDGRSYFWVPNGLGVDPRRNWHPRAREIGEQLHRMGHETLLLMRSGLDRVRDIVGDTAAHDLSAHWHLIGWKGTQDEYYAAKAQQVRAMMGERVNPETKLGLERTWQH